MYVDMQSEVPEEYEPKREAMTRGDLLLVAALAVACWFAVYGFAVFAAHVGKWILGVL